MTPQGSAALSAPIDPAAAARLLADLGFFAHPDLPNVAGDAYLLVALRDRPTLRHFDPERVDVWVNRGSRGSRLEIARQTAPLQTEFSWGSIVIVDRLGISNEYVACGGHLTVTDVGGVTIVVLVSSAPILRRGGHSQGWDQAAVDLAAFFGRVLLAVDYVAGFEARMAEAAPLARYAAFIAEAIARYRGSAPLRAAHADLWTLLGGEQARLLRDDPAAWAAGVDLVTAGGLVVPS